MKSASKNKIPVSTLKENIRFNDIFDQENIQHLQDAFSDATGVASIITLPDGKPITRQSNFCRLCDEVISKNDKGLSECMNVNELSEEPGLANPVIQQCRYAGLYNFSVRITVNGMHLGNWIIGQVRNEETDETKLIKYADESGADRQDFLKAFSEVRVMPVEQFKKVAKMLLVFVNQLTEKAYYNLQFKLRIAESEEALQKERLLLRAIIDNIPDSIYSKDLDGRKTLANKAELGLLGAQSESEVLGKDDFAFYTKEVAEKYTADDQSVLQTGLPIINREGFRYDEKGHKRWLLSSKIPLRDKDNLIVGLAGISHDITERKLALQTLHDSEEKYRLIFENSPLGILSFDDKGIIVACNNRFANILGTTVEKLVDFDMLAIADKKMVSCIKQALNGNIGLYEDVYQSVISKKRVLVRAFFTSIKIGEGQFSGGVGIIEDITERKHVEDALLVSEEKYRNIFENVQDVFYQTDLAGTVLEISPSIKSFAEYNSADIIGKPVSHLYYNPDEQEILLSEIQKRGELRDYEVTLKTKTGTKKYASLNANLIPDADGKPHHINGAIRDITTRKKAEIALRKSSSVYRNLVQRIPDGVYKSTPKGRFVDVNPAMVRMLGYSSKEELMSIDITKELYFDPTDRESLILQEQLEEMGVYRLKKKDGTEIWVEDHGWYATDENGKIIFHEGIMRDITERKLAEDMLKESEEQNRTILQTAMDGFLILDKHGRLLGVNDAYCKMSGYTSGELLDMHDYELMHFETQEESLKRLLLIETKGQDRFESQHRRKDGSVFDVEISVKYQNSGTNRYLTFIHDITDKKKKEQELVNAKEKAEESDKLKSAFLANMSHEIRTPMNGILGFADLLKTPDLSGSEQTEYIGIIKKSGERMLNIINDIVDISKIEAGQVKIFISETRINEQTEFLYSFFKPDADQKKIRLILRNGLIDTEAILNTDKEKLYAVLTNLVKNAIKFTGKGGTIEFGYIKKSNFLEFYVKDTGFGIPPDRQKAIFERFIQADIADSRAFQGAGLGLSISKAYVEMLGGEIWVESEEDKGSAFYFTIPFNAISEPIHLPDTDVLKDEKKQDRKLKILIVEDDETSEILISIAVRTMGREILKVKTGAEAIKICRQYPDIDLILMDIKMPEMDGYEATRQLRKFNKEVYIIAQTAFGLAEEREKALYAGCNEYISKPLDIALLRKLIREQFNPENQNGSSV